MQTFYNMLNEILSNFAAHTAQTGLFNAGVKDIWKETERAAELALL